jgi:hypothetical protein
MLSRFGRAMTFANATSVLALSIALPPEPWCTHPRIAVIDIGGLR